MMQSKSPVMTVDEAIKAQFRLVDYFTKNMSSSDLISTGDLGYGLHPELTRPYYTAKVETIIAEFFDAEDAALVWGAGSGAVRWLMTAALRSGDKVVFHSEPKYATTQVTVESMGIDELRCNFNDIKDLKRTLELHPKAIWLQHTPQCLTDTYDLQELIATVKEVAPDCLVLVDDNYAAMRFRRIGVQLGADASAISMFKIMGPPGIGCVIGKREIISLIREYNSSGGSKVEGPDALEALRGMINAPVMLAIQAETVRELARKINEESAALPGIKRASASCANEWAVVVELDEPRAREVVQASREHGSAPFPIGGESKFEVAPLFYRLAKTYIKSQPSVEDWYFRINPHRAGVDTVMPILRKSLSDVFQK